MADADTGGLPSIEELLRLGREAMAERRYAEARERFDAALKTAPDDPRVQSLAVMAEFWRRLARDGDGFGAPPDPAARLRPKAPTGPVAEPAPTQVSPPAAARGADPAVRGTPPPPAPPAEKSPGANPAAGKPPKKT